MCDGSSTIGDIVGPPVTDTTGDDLVVFLDNFLMREEIVIVVLAHKGNLSVVSGRYCGIGTQLHRNPGHGQLNPSCGRSNQHTSH